MVKWLGFLVQGVEAQGPPPVLGDVFHVSSSPPGCVVDFIAQNLTVNLSFV